MGKVNVTRTIADVGITLKAIQSLIQDAMQQIQTSVSNLLVSKSISKDIQC
jgi:hypothetical protein